MCASCSGCTIGQITTNTRNRLWLVTVTAPFGHAEKMLEELKTTSLAGKRFKFMRRDAQG